MGRWVIGGGTLAVALLACGPKVAATGTDEEEEGVDALTAVCRDGCQRFGECEYPERWDPAPGWECEEACVDFWGSCSAEAMGYLECVLEVSCDEWQLVLTDPRGTACDADFADAAAACGL